MSLDNIDIDSWGKKEDKPDQDKDAGPDDKKEKVPRQPRPKPLRQEKPAESDDERKPKKTVPLDDVPIDALRGLYYFVIEKTDKKLSKAELKRNLKEFLSSREKFDKLLQNIVDAVFS
nr:hypothetical protein [Candidatus Sigynarchaeota archaeon]